MMRITGRMSREGAERAAMVRARAWTVASWAALLFAVAMLVDAIRWW
jgi:hypothetical protein